MDPWEQDLVMPQVASTELLCSRDGSVTAFQIS